MTTCRKIATRRAPWWLALALIAAMAPLGLADDEPAAPADEPAAVTDDSPAPAPGNPAPGRPAAPASGGGGIPPAKLALMKEATATLDKLIVDYMAGNWEPAAVAAKELLLKNALLTPAQQRDLKDIRTNIALIRPEWWKNVTASSNISFRAGLWGRTFIANYVPSMALGEQGVRAEGKYRMGRDGEYKFHIEKLTVLVTWKPGLVNSPDAAEGKLAQVQNVTLGDLGEVIVWHELGHNYITSNLPMKAVIELYENHQIQYVHLQEFYADMSALYHASPRARRVALWLRLQGLDYYDEAEAHTRASHAIGSLLLAKVLEDPSKWPSIHLPPAVPKNQPELNTIIYMYERWDPTWTFPEDQALRAFAREFIERKGNDVLRTGGSVPLPSKINFHLMAAQDREHQIKRDAWVTEKLTAAIDAGRADPADPKAKYDPPNRKKTNRTMRMIREDHDLRIQIPW